MKRKKDFSGNRRLIVSNEQGDSQKVVLKFLCLSAMIWVTGRSVQPYVGAFMHSLIHKALLVFLFVALLLVIPTTALANGPVPPRNPFQAPPTPTPAVLPFVETPTPSVAPSDALSSAQPERDDPGPEDTAVFLPFIGSSLFSSSHVADDENHADDPLTEAFTYTVQKGDTLSDLAIEFGRDLRTMSCVRDIDGAAIVQLQVGREIIIPALSDLCHRVKKGETLDKIAAWYGVDKESLLATPQNDLASEADLRVGQYLLISEARSRYRDPAEENVPRVEKSSWRYGDGEFIWPIERQLTWISQSFRHGKHMATDMAARSGTKVRASDTGKVIKVGWSDNGYGYRIVIDHGIDYVTIYAHLSEYYVEEGDIVTKGEVIGAVGSTGNSTGPHLHFEIRDYGYLVDPLMLLPK